MAKVDIWIKKDGTVAYEVNGVKGVGCEQITRVLSESLGTVVESELRPEYFVEIEDMTVELYDTNE